MVIEVKHTNSDRSAFEIDAGRSSPPGQDLYGTRHIWSCPCGQRQRNRRVPGVRTRPGPGRSVITDGGQIAVPHQPTGWEIIPATSRMAFNRPGRATASSGGRSQYHNRGHLIPSPADLRIELGQAKGI